MAGTPGNENISFTGGNDGGKAVGDVAAASGMLGDEPGSISVEGDDCALPSGMGIRGSAAKNSLASLAITAGSGHDDKANGFSYFCAPSLAETAAGLPSATRSPVVMILVDTDVIQNAHGVVG
jgi:hypothetical protein